ncbi:MAG: recombinase family protein [Peptostreptococcaceae bacterium]
MIYGYARVSSKKQLNEGNGLEAQIKTIKEKYPHAEITTEQYTGGVVLERPKFKELVDKLKDNDTLVVTKLDRIARNTQEGLEIVQQLFRKGVAVHVLNVGLLEDSTMGRFFLTTMLAIAEMEKETIRERLLGGREIARTKEGYQEGRPAKYSKEDYEKAAKLKQEGKTYAQVKELTGIGKTGLWDYMKNNK